MGQISLRVHRGLPERLDSPTPSIACVYRPLCPAVSVNLDALGVHDAEAGRKDFRPCYTSTTAPLPMAIFEKTGPTSAGPEWNPGRPGLQAARSIAGNTGSKCANCWEVRRQHSRTGTRFSGGTVRRRKAYKSTVRAGLVAWLEKCRLQRLAELRAKAPG